MRWTCPYQINNECVRLRKPYQHLQKGCVLEGKVKFIDNQLDNEYKMNLKREGEQDGKVRSNCRI